LDVVAQTTSVPETAIDEDHYLLPRENHVWLAWKAYSPHFPVTIGGHEPKPCSPE
jgi:hypothetical protein